MANKLKKDVVLMQWFSKLSHPSDNTRIKAGDSIIKYVVSKQKGEKKWSDTLVYALGRFLQGICSSNKASRVGYATTLSALLQTIKVTSDDDVQKLIDIFNDKRKIVMNKPDEKHVLFGQVFFYLAMIRSVQFRPDSIFYMKLFSNLVTLSKKKSYLEPPCYEGINQLIEKTPKYIFERDLWPELSDVLSCGWDECHPTLLLLLDTCTKCFPDLCGSSYLVMNNWINSGKSKKYNIFGVNSFKYLGKILTKSVEVGHPKMHAVVTRILLEIKKMSSSNIIKFWKECVEEHLMNSSQEKKYLALRIAVHLLPYLDEKHVKSIWSKNLVMGLFYALSNKSNAIRMLCKTSLCAELNTSLKSTEIKPGTQLAFMFLLLSSPISIKLDNMTETSFLATTARNLKLTAILKYIEWLKMYYVTGKSGNNNIVESNIDVIRKWCCAQFTMLAKTEVLLKRSDVIMEIVKFVFLFAFFIPTHPSVLSKELNLHADDSEIVEISVSARKTNIQCFYKTFSVIGNISSHESVYSFFSGIIGFSVSLLKSDKVEAVSPMNKEIEEEWQLMSTDVKSLQEKYPKGFHAFVSLTMSMILMFNGINLLCGDEEERQSAKNTSTELRIIVGDSLANPKQFLNQAKGEWDGLLTEILISKLAQPIHTNRVFVDIIFKLLCPAVGKLSLNLILEAIDPKSSLDDGMEEDDENDDEDEKDIEEESEDESSSEEHDSAFSESEEDVDDGFKQKITSALGPAAVTYHSTTGSDSEEDLSDDAMMRLDPILVEVFKQQSKGKNAETEKMQIDFKLRCLDLIEILASWRPKDTQGVDIKNAGTGHPILLLGVQNLFDLAQRYSNYEKFKHLSERLTVLLKLKICKMKNVEMDSFKEEDISELYVDLKKLLMSACNAQSQFFCRLALSCGELLTRMLLGSKDVEVEQNISDTCMSVISNFLTEEDSVMLSDVFVDISTKFPKISTSLIPELLKYLSTSIKPYRKLQVYTMLNNLYITNIDKMKDKGIVTEIFQATLNEVLVVNDDPEKLRPKILIEVVKLLKTSIETSDKMSLKLVTESNAVEELKKFVELPQIRDKNNLLNATWNILSKYEKRQKFDQEEKSQKKAERRKKKLEKKLKRKAAAEETQKLNTEAKKKTTVNEGTSDIKKKNKKKKSKLSESKAD